MGSTYSFKQTKDMYLASYAASEVAPIVWTAPRGF